MGRHGREGQPPGVLLQLGKWEAPAHWPKENKPQTEQYTVCCLCDERPASLCLSAPRGVGQINVSPNSTEPKRTPMDLASTLKLPAREPGDSLESQFQNVFICAVSLSTKYVVAPDQSRTRQPHQGVPARCRARNHFSRKDRQQKAKSQASAVRVC